MGRSRNQLNQAEVASAVFAEIDAHGVSRVSLTQVARASGLSVGALYGRFPNRRALLRFAYETFHTNLGDCLDARCGDAPETTPFPAFWQLLTLHLLRAAQGRAFMTLHDERPSFQTPEEQAQIVPRTLEWWLNRNRPELGTAPVEVHARIVWGMLRATASEPSRLAHQEQNRVHLMGAACWAALRAGREALPTPAQQRTTSMADCSARPLDAS